MNTLVLGTIADERQRRFRSRADQGSEAEQVLADALASHAAAAIGEQVRTAYEFAKSLDYEHPGLSSASYLAHPIRVAELMLTLPRTITGEGVVLALLHNVFEHTSVSRATMSERFGSHIADAIDVLTVDRSQVSPEYTAGYYDGIRLAPLWVQQVKVLDKFDNLFLLCLNPSATVRAAYLADIEHYVVPMAQACLPDLVSYLRALIDDCRNTGYLQEA